MGDVLLYVYFGLVGEWENVEVFVVVFVIVEKILEFRMLVFWVLLVEFVVV